jgi:hypothetical protein
LTILANLGEKNSQRIFTEDESWFASLIEPDAMFAASPAEVTQWSDHQCRAERLRSHFFHGKRLTDFGCPTERINVKPGLFHWYSTPGFEPNQDWKFPPQRGTDSDGVYGQFNVA